MSVGLQWDFDARLTRGGRTGVTGTRYRIAGTVRFGAGIRRRLPGFSTTIANESAAFGRRGANRSQSNIYLIGARLLSERPLFMPPPMAHDTTAASGVR
jgi:hypothetical protein